MSAQVISVNGTALPKLPTKFSIERYNLTKSGRTASGKMTMELIAKKRKFLFEYEVISGTDMKAILDIIDRDDMFMELSYVENGDTKTAQVYVGSIPSEQFRTDGRWYWKGFKFDLIEQ